MGECHLLRPRQVPAGLHLGHALLGDVGVPDHPSLRDRDLAWRHVIGARADDEQN